MTALHEIERRGGHVITQVVKTELVIRTESDIAGIGLAALVRIGTVLIDTIDGEAKEHIDRTIPLRVTLGQVIVDGDYMHTFVGEGVEVYREGCHKGLTFTRCHLGDLTLVQYHAAEELDIVMDHIPGDLVTACHPVIMIDGLVAVDIYEIKAAVCSQVLIHLGCRDDNGLTLCKTACGRLDDRVGFGQDLVEYFFVAILDLFLEFIHFVVDLLALLDGRRFDGCFELRNAILTVLDRRLQLIHQRPRMRTQIVIAQRVNRLILRFDLVHYRLNGAHIFLRLVAE